VDESEADRREPFAIGDLPIGRVMDEALALVKRHGWQAAMVGVAPWAPIQAAYLVVRHWTWQEGWIAGTPLLYFVDWAWGTIIGGLLTAPLTAGVFYIFATAYLGRPVRVAEGFRHAARCWPVVAPIYLLLHAMVGMGSNFVCFLPVIVLVMAVYFHLVVMSLEGTGPIDALGRGIALMRGRVAVIFLVVLAYTLIDASLQTLAYSLGTPYLYAFAQPIMQAPVIVFFSAVVVVMYISARSRYEAIDLQLLADDIAAEAGENPPIRL